MRNSNFDNFCDLYDEFINSTKNTIPLCAAENVVSPFSRIPLSSSIQEKYVLGGITSFNADINFVGSDLLHKYFDIINKQCKKLFDSTYSDPRTLSGVNAVMSLLMSVFEFGDEILISCEDSGGHGSMKKICTRLGIKSTNLPFNFDEFDFEYDKLNKLLKTGKYKGILICPSDITFMPDFSKLILPEDCILIFDATQVLGLIAGKAVKNPFSYFSKNQKVILMGATHKTLPGPTCGIIMTQNENLANEFDTKINPDYLRNNHLHHILSLSLVLFEMEYFGKEYASNIVYTSNYLGKSLENNGFEVLKRNKVISETHQIFVSMNETEGKEFLEKCKKLKISLNFRNKKLYKNSGLRIGTQEIARYKWTDENLDELSQIFKSIYSGNIKDTELLNKIEIMAKNKNIYYTFNSDIYTKLTELHNSEHKI